MNLTKECTRVDCFPVLGPGKAQQSQTCASFSPAGRPGSLVFVGASTGKESIGNQVACKLSVNHFTSGVLDFYNGALSEKPTNGEEIASAALEAGFRQANAHVYNFGHKLAAGGRLATGLVALVLDAGAIAAGRVGRASIFLYRGGELFPFFEGIGGKDASQRGAESLGSNSLVSVEVASVPREGLDAIIAFSEELNEGQQEELVRLLAEEPLSNERMREILEMLFDGNEEKSFAISVALGPETYFLAPEFVVENAPYEI